MRERQCPTQREVAAGLGYSQAAAGQHIAALVKKGYLLTLPTKTSRNLRMTQCAIEKLRLTGPQPELDLKVEEG